MHKNLFGIAAIIAACGFLLQSINPAHAILPVGMSHGDFPYQVFTTPDIGTDVSVTLLTVPADKNFIITTISASGECDIYIGANKIVGDRNRDFFTSETTGMSGNLRWLVPSNEALIIGPEIPEDDVCYYFIQGYYAHAPS